MNFARVLYVQTGYWVVNRYYILCFSDSEDFECVFPSDY